ncbi:MAG: YqzL family protein [Natronincolaceae bacterium]|nr:YqzL family protein [Bacillota bacterium]NLK90218.1 YqzL family protein [Clostridiales bacterium]
MLDKIMWNIFEETGNIYAYLYVKECNEYSEKCNEYCYNKNEESDIYAKNPMKLNGVTIVT